MDPFADDEPRASGAFVCALLLAGLACAYLGWIVGTTDWGMDADESVHSVEAMRLYSDLSEGAIGDFFVHTYFPERWHPPVNQHVRWYPFVHAWSLLPSFLLLGPSDFAARVPSVLFLYLTCIVFFELARTLARDHRETSGLLAVGLLLTAPNVLTFSAQALIATSSLFTCFLALRAYLWSLEAGHPRSRALWAGGLLGLAMLTKYDHGGMLALCLGINELIRVRFSILELFRSGAGALLVLAAVLVAGWFAHPEKVHALRDTLSHPFYGTPRTILMDFVLTWFTEYGSSVAVGLLAFLSLFAFRSRLADPKMRAVWIWAVVGGAFYVLRGRYHFRYNFVEAPVFLLLLAVALPVWVDNFGARLARRGLRRTGAGILLVLVSAAGVAVGLVMWISSDLSFEAMREPFRWFHGLKDTHWGMSRAPDVYIDELSRSYGDFAVYFGSSLAALSFALFVTGAAMLLSHRAGVFRRAGVQIASVVLAIATVPGAVGLYLRLPAMVEWELECHPELDDLRSLARLHVEPGDTLLLGGGWDQLTNNALRWHFATRPGRNRERLGFDEVEVVGDMIGSVAFPAEPRIAWWTERLATAPLEELPERILLVEPGDDFLYQTRFGPEVELYRRVLAERRSHDLLASASFPLLDCTVTIWGRSDQVGPPFEGARALLDEFGVLAADPATESSRLWVGEGGWSMRDESLRHFIARRER